MRLTSASSGHHAAADGRWHRWRSMAAGRLIHQISNMCHLSARLAVRWARASAALLRLYERLRRPCRQVRRKRDRTNVQQSMPVAAASLRLSTTFCTSRASVGQKQRWRIRQNSRFYARTYTRSCEPHATRLCAQEQHHAAGIRVEL